MNSKGAASAHCSACEIDGHVLPNCFYLFPDKAYAGFEPREHIQQRVENNLKKREVKEEYERITGKKAKKSDEDQN